MEWKRSARVSLPYPFPYGFIIGTTAADGCNVDCFVITSEPLQTGDVLECEALGLMEQFEDGHADHNVLARPLAAAGVIEPATQRLLADFVTGVFVHIPGKQVSVGWFLGQDEALAHIAAHID